jgi:hypothetical protein
MSKINRFRNIGTKIMIVIKVLRAKPGMTLGRHRTDFA